MTASAEPVADKAQKTDWFAKIKDVNEKASTLLGLVFKVVLPLIVLVLFSYYSCSDAIKVGVIVLPASLVQNGLSANELTYRLADAIKELKQAGRPEEGQGVWALESDLAVPDVDVPGANMSLQKLVTLAQAALNTGHRRVVSEVSARSGGSNAPESTRNWLLTARMPGHPAHQTAFNPADPEPALRAIARELLGDVEPVILVRALILSGDCDEARRRARAHVARSVSAADLSQLYNAVGLASECPSTEGEPGNDAAPDNGEAARFYSRAIGADSRNVHPRINLARIRIRQGDTAGALADFEWAAGRKPDLAQTHESWGVALYELERFKEAIPHLDNATRLEPRSAFAYLYLAKSRLALGDTEQALQDFALALARNPNDLDALRAYGHELYARGDFIGASAAFGRATRIDPTEVYTQLRLANSLERAARPAAACVYERVLRLATPGDPHYAEAVSALTALAATGRGTCGTS